MITVELKSPPATIAELISFAARTCYEAEMPSEIKKLIDIEQRLWKTGHHSTLQHASSTFEFAIEGIAVGDITFGLHLDHPFYNSSQRSGRFCGKMFSNPDFESMMGYVLKYWPDLNPRQQRDVGFYLKAGVGLYQLHFEKAEILAKEFIKQERPHANESYLKNNGPKIAQEQLRMFIPVVFPTAVFHTLDLSALAALYAVAWTPVLKEVTQQMAEQVLREAPSFIYMFKRIGRNLSPCDNVLNLKKRVCEGQVKEKPELRLIYAEEPESDSLCDFTPEEIHPLDTLHFSPMCMDHNTVNIKTEVQISVATMGQDQRHRTIRRGLPRFTGAFYLPPIPARLGLQNEAREIMDWWNGLARTLPSELACLLAPYGAMVRYKKVGSYNAIIHEQAKRLCWCAQEEIYHVARSFREQVSAQVSPDNKVLSAMCPACVLQGKCGEGVRCCGRDLRILKDNPFPERKI